MKKFMPIFILCLGAVAIVAVYFVFRPKAVVKSDDGQDLMKLSLQELPIISLTPTSDGHYLDLKVEKIKINKAVYMDFQFLYEVPGKVAQGSSGDNIDITSGSYKTSILLGSESSGKFRYDEGVEKGGLTLWFRDKDKKLLAKLETDFVMKRGANEIVSSDGVFKYMPRESKNFFVVMETLGIPDGYPFDPMKIIGPYGVFSSSDDDGHGIFEDGKVYVYDQGWSESSKGLGIYALLK